MNINNDRIANELSSIVGAANVLVSEPLKNHTTFKIGGPADIMVLPGSADDVASVIGYCSSNGVSYFVMGNGSNLLVNDSGIRRVVIKIGDRMKKASIEKNGENSYLLRAEAGILLSELSNLVVSNSLAGFEFASGIPGTLGGGVYMNAGAYDGELANVVRAVTCVMPNGEILRLEGDELGFGYRSSAFQSNGCVVAGVEIVLQKGDIDKITEKIKDFTYRRTSKQPLSLPSAGSTFKRPEGHFAGKLIEDAGLRGLVYNGAAVSEKHCGFVVNIGSATFSDVTTLIGTVQKTVRDKFGVSLETEVRIIGEGF